MKTEGPWKVSDERFMGKARNNVGKTLKQSNAFYTFEKKPGRQYSNSIQQFAHESRREPNTVNIYYIHPRNKGNACRTFIKSNGSCISPNKNCPKIPLSPDLNSHRQK